MSIVFAVATEQFGMIMTDTRSVNSVTLEVLSNNELKLRHLSDNVVMGVAGNGTVAKQIFENVAISPDSFIEACVIAVHSEISRVAFANCLLHCVLFGYTKNNELQITVISSSNGFVPMDSVIQGQKPVCCLAPPTDDPVLFKNYKQIFEHIADRHKDIDDLRGNLVNQIKEIAKTNEGISGTVNICQIKKGGKLEWIKIP